MYVSICTMNSVADVTVELFSRPLAINLTQIGILGTRFQSGIVDFADECKCSSSAQTPFRLVCLVQGML